MQPSFPELTEPTPANADPCALEFAKQQLLKGVETLYAQGYRDSSHIIARIQCGIDLLNIDISRRVYELADDGTDFAPLFTPQQALEQQQEFMQEVEELLCPSKI